MTHALPAGARVLGTDEHTKGLLAWELTTEGGGKAVFLGFRWLHAMREHSLMLSSLLTRLGSRAARGVPESQPVDIAADGRKPLRSVRHESVHLTTGGRNPMPSGRTKRGSESRSPQARTHEREVHRSLVTRPLPGSAGILPALTRVAHAVSTLVQFDLRPDLRRHMAR